ncbi:MAG: M13 family metallopeptidase [Lachnospiraceae bacterium]|nr:M13 family metallopeptidase [Lachnospiraceae bacterium]
MKRFRRLTAFLCAASLLVFSGCSVEMPEVTDAEENAETENAPMHIRAQDDFYGYVNYETLRNAEFEYGESDAASAFNSRMINEQVKEIIRDVAAGNGYAAGTEEYIIKTAYDKFLQYDFDNAPVPEVIDDLLHEIDEVSSLEELFRIDVKLQRDFGCSGLLNIAVTENYLEPGGRVIAFGQYTAVFDADFESLEDTYGPLDSLKSSASAILQALGHDKDEADEIGKKLGYMAMDLYNSTDMDIPRASDPYKYFQLYSADEIKEIVTIVDLDEYLSDLGYDLKYCDKFGVMDPVQLRQLNDLFALDNLEALKAWEICSVGSQFNRFLTSAYESLAEYRNIDYRSEEEQVLNEIVRVYFDQTDPLYVERYYSEAVDRALISMCDDIREGYRQLITDADWLSAQTRRGLLEKLDNIIYVTGTDLERQDPADYRSVGGSDYFEFYLSYQMRKTRELIESLSEPCDRKEITMPMQMFNACYDPSRNNITITAAITNAPFFDINADYYTNLGGLGMVIAHEMGHAFDSNCILFDQNGAYDPSWIAASDMDALNERNETAARYFEDNFTIFGVYHVDGEQTLGENYADLGSLECIVSLTSTDEERKLLFENFARVWCCKMVASSLIDQLEYDEHSPDALRVNSILSTIDEFYTTYHVAQSDAMYVAPENRISRWH